MERPYYYVRDEPEPAPAHHWDYRYGRDDHALCGHPFDEPQWQGSTRPVDVCAKCDRLLPDWLSELWEDSAAAREQEWCAEWADRERRWSKEWNEREREWNKRQSWYERQLDRAEAQLKTLRDKEEQRLEKIRRRRRLPPPKIVQGGLPGTGRR